MTGKDLLLVAIVAGAAGAGAAVGVGLLAQPQGPDPAMTELADRLGRIESALARTEEQQKGLKDSVAGVSERVSGLDMAVGEIRLAQGAQKQAADESSAEAPRPGRAGRMKRVLTDGSGERVVLGTDGGFTIGGTNELGGAIAEEVAKRMRGAAEGFRLRMLPEADRWKKAQEDLRLTDAQVEALKRAAADRAASLKDAVAVETDASTSPGGGTRFTLRRMNPEKVAAAQSEYSRRVAETLDNEQKKSWDEKGWDHAFGGGPESASIVIATSVETTESSEKP